MRVTGWTVPELRAAPARVVRAHFARIFAGLLWSPQLAEAARSPTPPRTAFVSIRDYADARAAKERAGEVLRAVETVLWPEGDDG